MIDNTLNGHHFKTNFVNELNCGQGKRYKHFSQLRFKVYGSWSLKIHRNFRKFICAGMVPLFLNRYLKIYTINLCLFGAKLKTHIDLTAYVSTNITFTPRLHCSFQQKKDNSNAIFLLSNSVLVVRKYVEICCVFWFYGVLLSANIIRLDS